MQPDRRHGNETIFICETSSHPDADATALNELAEVAKRPGMGGRHETFVEKQRAAFVQPDAGLTPAEMGSPRRKTGERRRDDHHHRN